VVEMTDATFATEIGRFEGWVLINFGDEASDPCLKLKPIYQQITRDYQDQMKFASVNVDNCPATANKYAVSDIPTLILYWHDNEVRRQIGFRREEHLRTWLDTYVK